MTTNTELIEKLKQIQGQQALTDGQMAEKLGCTRQLYQATKTGRIPIGLTILKGATKAFPEVIGDAIIFLTDGAHRVTAMPNLATAHTETHQEKQQGGLRHLVNSLILGLKNRIWGKKDSTALEHQEKP